MVTANAPGGLSWTEWWGTVDGWSLNRKQVATAAFTDFFEVQGHGAPGPFLNTDRR
ncbi:MAG: hypothetical protein GY835_19910 [bacterium]|nr:hypothetical protein [bacterium]